jgi:hypothetical protein
LENFQDMGIGLAISSKELWVASITMSSGWASAGAREREGVVIYVAGAEGSGNVAGTREGKGGHGTGFEACDMAQHTSRLAELHILQVCQKTLGLGPLLPVSISSINTKRTYLPQATVKLEGRRVHICLTRDVWNAGRKSTHVNWPSVSFVAERTLVIRCLELINHRDWKRLKISKTECFESWGLGLEAGMALGTAEVLLYSFVAQVLLLLTCGVSVVLWTEYSVSEFNHSLVRLIFAAEQQVFPLSLNCSSASV